MVAIPSFCFINYCILLEDLFDMHNLLEYIELLWCLIMDFIPSNSKTGTYKERRFCDNNKIYVEIHEWGGYQLKRIKCVNRIPKFECGLKYQLDRFNNYQGKYKVNLTITMSDPELHNNINQIVHNCDNFIVTDNRGKDFSGYSTFYESIKNKNNAYVILSNTSVSNYICPFLEDYIDYMNENLDVGMMGISYNSRCYQSLRYKNFTPHLQSFFLLTTIDVLNEVVSFNKSFPGSNIDNKLLLIREGEIKLSQIVLSLGYKLAVVTTYGVVKFNNDRQKWNLKYGDSRIGSKTPNAILPIRNVSTD